MFDNYSEEFSACDVALDVRLCENSVIGFIRQAELTEYYLGRIVEALVLILIFSITFLIIRWLFRLVADIALGW